MNQKKAFCKKPTRSLLLTSMFFLAMAVSTYAQKASTIIALRLNGKSANSVPCTVLSPGSGGNNKTVNVGDQFKSGTTLIIPLNTIVVLRSAGGQQEVTPVNSSKPIEYKIEFTEHGESHVVKGMGAQIVNTVNKTLGYNYRNKNEKGTTAASKGTVFTFTDLSEPGKEKAIIKTKEGTINIIDKVPCTVNGQPIKTNRRGGVATKAVAKTQSAGDNEYTSTNSPVEYGDYKYAVDYIQKEINNEIEKGGVDPEDLADDLMCLGDLYMDMKEPAKAIKPFEDAANYYAHSYGEDDLSTTEARLAAAEAYIKSGNNEQGLAIVKECIKNLEEDLSEDEEDLAYLKENGDEEGEEILCDDIAETCAFLGWAYEIEGDEAKSEQYYTRSEANCD